MSIPALTQIGQVALTTAATYSPEAKAGFIGAAALDVQAELAYGSGGGTGKAYFQTSLDQGATWFDLWCFTFAAATKRQAASFLVGAPFVAPLTNLTLADDTRLSSPVLGDRFKWVVVTSGAAYSGITTFRSWVHVR